jgi:hypothetical protein
MFVVFVAADPTLALALPLAALLKFGDAIYCIQAKQQELTNCLLTGERNTKWEAKKSSRPVL